MHLIVYSSKFTGSSSSATEVLDQIVAAAEERNRDAGISGILLFQNGYFLQALEGDEIIVRSVFQKIQSDRRHSELVLHADQSIASRSFYNWSMDGFAIDDPELFDSETIGVLQKLYNKTFELNPKALIEFIKSIIDEIDTFKIQMDHNMFPKTTKPK